MATDRETARRIEAAQKLNRAEDQYRALLAARKALTADDGAAQGSLGLEQAQTGVENAERAIVLARDAMVAAKCDAESIGEAEALVIESHAEADALRAKLDELKPTPAVVEESK